MMTTAIHELEVAPPLTRHMPNLNPFCCCHHIRLNLLNLCIKCVYLSCVLQQDNSKEVVTHRDTIAVPSS